MTLLPSCHEVQSQLTDYLEGALPLRRRLGLRLHLLLCRVCAGFLRGLRALPGLGKRTLAPPAEPPPDAAKVLAEVLAALSKR
jgi:hypothetical protein